MERDEAFAVFRASAAEILRVAPERVVPDARLTADLDADSLDLVELVMDVQERLGLAVQEAILDDVVTVGDAFAVIEAALA